MVIAIIIVAVVVVNVWVMFKTKVEFEVTTVAIDIFEVLI